jgi:saccharopine dehydrogenase-like NADP-dependent oxidoreductase
MKNIFVRGSGDVGSAAAHALFMDGFAVLIHDSA